MSNPNLRVDRNFPLSKLQPVANGDFLLCLPVFQMGNYGVARESLADTPIHSGDRG